MALGMRNQGWFRRAKGRGELDLILDFMSSDDVAATVAGSVTPAACECPPTEYPRKLSGVYTLADDGAQLFFVHKARSSGPSKDPGSRSYLRARSAQYLL